MPKKPTQPEKPQGGLPEWKSGYRPARVVATAVMPARVLEYVEYYGRAAYYQPFCNEMLGGKRLKHPVTHKRLNSEECLAWAVAEFSTDEAQQIRAARVAAELEKIAYADPGNYFSWGPEGVGIRESTDLSLDERAAVAEISDSGGTVKPKLHDKTAALRLLGQTAGMFTEKREEKVELSGPDGAFPAIEVHIVDHRPADKD